MRLMLLLQLLWSGASERARAQDDEALQQASSHFDRGVAFIEEGSYEQAVLEFERAHALSGSDAVLYNLGMAYVAVGRPVEAIRALTRYSAQQGEVLTEPERAHIDETLAGQRALVSHVQLDIAPVGARVRLDGRDLGAGPFEPELMLRMGEHWLEVSHPGYPGVVRSFTLGLQPLLLRVALSGQLQQRGSRSPKQAHLDVAQWYRQSGSTALTVGYVLGGVGLAAGFTALTLFLVADQHFDEWEQENQELRTSEWLARSMADVDAEALASQQADNNDRLRSVWRMDDAALGLAISAGALVLTGTILIWTVKARQQRDLKRVGLALHGTGLRVHGAF